MSNNGECVFLSALYSLVLKSLHSEMNAEKYFKTRNLYEILQVSPNAEIQEGM